MNVKNDGTVIERKGVWEVVKNKDNQTYRYIKANSILQGSSDYVLNQEEYYLLYNFFVTYSVCGNQSFQKRNFIDYGWTTDCIIRQKKADTDLGKIFKNHIKFNITVFKGKSSISDLFYQSNLTDGILIDYDTERAVLGKTGENNQYLKLFYHIRNCLAHGKFALKYSSNKEKMIVLQDDNKYNVTARIVLKLQTLIELIFAIDKNKLIVGNITADMIKPAA